MGIPKKKKVMMTRKQHDFKRHRQKKKSLQKFKVTKNLNKMTRSSAPMLKAQQKQDVPEHGQDLLSPCNHEHYFQETWGLLNQTLEFDDRSGFSFQEPQEGTLHDTPAVHSIRNETQDLQDLQKSTAALEVPPGNEVDDLAQSLRALTLSLVTTSESSCQAQSVQQRVEEQGSLLNSWIWSTNQPSIQESSVQAQSVQQRTDEHGSLLESWALPTNQPSFQESHCQEQSIRERAATLNYPIEYDERGCSQVLLGRLSFQAVRFNIPVEHAEHAYQQDSRRRSQYELPIQESNGQAQSVHGHVIRFNVPTEHDERAHQQEPRGRSLYQLPLQESSGLPQSMQEQATRRNVPVENDED